MFEPVIDAWARYSRLLGAVLPSDDARLLRSAEIHTRFGQLDMLLRRVGEILDNAARSGGDVSLDAFLETWDWASIYSDAFYFFGWRIIDLVNDDRDARFPHLEPVRPAGMLVVRSHLLDFPEGQGEYVRHALEFRDELGEKIGRAIAALEAEADPG